MISSARLAIAAAAVVIVAAAGIVFIPRSGGIGGPDPTASSTPSSPPTPSVAPSVAPSSSIVSNPGPTRFPLQGPLTPGTTVIGDPFVLNVSLTVPEGWSVWAGLSRAGGAIYKESPDPPNGRGVVVTTVDKIFKNACDDTEGQIDPGPTTTDLATALSKQRRTIASPITQITLAGYSGTHVRYALGGPDEPGCESLDRWPTPMGPRQAIMGESDELWILDVDGVRLVIDAFSFPGVTAAQHGEVQLIVDSIKIEP